MVSLGFDSCLEWLPKKMKPIMQTATKPIIQKINFEEDELELLLLFVMF
jgi:hypothetical protein